ncbi:hypothetical protein [Gluconobacter cerinus]|uniref:hypothetical protein n=1 Tax=Gluconobacter cerinus TaxID=38307 RepID=UPI001B8BF561|nr:hypothetical protein [Gluconobacter cerinus]MBS1034988.1 hypothetical protein [Gluconobacter cerinus]
MKKAILVFFFAISPSFALANPQIFGFLPEKCADLNSLDFSPSAPIGENVIGYFSGLNMATVIVNGGKSNDNSVEKIQSVDFITSSVHEICLSKPDIPLSTAVTMFWASRIKSK